MAVTTLETSAVLGCHFLFWLLTWHHLHSCCFKSSVCWKTLSSWLFFYSCWRFDWIVHIRWLFCLFSIFQTNNQTNKRVRLHKSHTWNTWLPVDEQWAGLAPPLLVEMWMWNSSLRETVTDDSVTSVTAQHDVDRSRSPHSLLASWYPNSWWVVHTSFTTCF